MPTCARCGGVIGVFEPALTRAAGRLFDSSHTTRSQLDHNGAAHFHRACVEPRRRVA